MRPAQNGFHIADTIFKHIFFQMKKFILIDMFLNCISDYLIDNKWALVDNSSMLNKHPAVRPLPESMMTKIHDAALLYNDV